MVFIFRMKKGQNLAKELYRELRERSCAELWDVEVPRFEKASPRERLDRVGLLRAVGVVFAEHGTEEQIEAVKGWLRKCLQDPEEKIRRYAMAALPKLGAGAGEEAQLLGLLQTTTAEREKKFLGKSLNKIGGAATLEALAGSAEGVLAQTAMKVTANVARDAEPSTVRLDRTLPQFDGLKIYLRGRYGLEGIVRDEVEDARLAGGKFRVVEVRRGLVIVTPIAPFSLGDLYALRCFGSVGFEIGMVKDGEDAAAVEALAKVITSRVARLLLKTFTEGSLRYRLNFAAKGHQRGAVQAVANRAFALSPEILNDPRSAPWSIDIHPGRPANTVELRPRLTPDPRLEFRLRDVPAASHPPLAACLARIAGTHPDEVVWDPFCGSGLELIERALLGGVRRVIGTDLSAEAVEISQENFAAANVRGVEGKFLCGDFRDFARMPELRPGSVSLVLTNPPMGKRVPIPDLRGLIEDLFAAAATVLRPGGRLVLANPLRTEIREPSLTLEWWQVVDFGGFDCRMEVYTKGQ
jgi:predicted RNA methylase